MNFTARIWLPGSYMFQIQGMVFTLLIRKQDKTFRIQSEFFKFGITYLKEIILKT